MTIALEPETTAQEPHNQNLPNRVPVATYRLQLNQSFTFAQTCRIVAYLDSLGISDLYASPLFRARPESTHGYDIADHNSFNPGLGGGEAFDKLAHELREHGMGLLLDIVPNHMGIGESSNAWWMDVLQNGPSSPYAPYFDIDWHPIKQELENRVLLPILGQQYGRVLEAQELQVCYEEGAFDLRYYEHCLPVNPRSYPDILNLKLDNLVEQLGETHQDVLDYLSIITGLNNLPPRTETDTQKVAERHREKDILKRRLDTLYTSSEAVRATVDGSVQTINGTAGDPRSFDLLDHLIERQAYRLAYWRVAAEEINYRRFFDVNDLAAIRMEREDVFQATHRLLLELLARNNVTGLRLDHPDGLYDPAGYFTRLQEAYASLEASDLGMEARDGSELSSPKPQAPSPKLYVLAEKILGRGEVLPQEWPVSGTTGYEFMNALTGVLVDTTAERRFTEIYSDFIDRRINFDELVYETRKQIMRIALASEVTVLAHQLSRVAEHNRYYRDFTLNTVREVLREVLANFPVYRTYIVASTDTVSERDQQVIEQAVARARSRNPAAEPTIYDFIRDVLLLRYPGTSDEAIREEQRQFVMKFQQVSGPVMAKGLEDTAFYVYNRLTALNEVGGEPRHFGTSIAAFHRQNVDRLRAWPFSMLATSTHDTKRSEDVRARISVLSERPDEWRRLLGRLSRLNGRKKVEVDNKLAPDRNEEYLFYQTVLGTLPLEPMNAEAHATYVERIQKYMTKAIREAKVHTSWLNPNNEYDDAVTGFVKAVLDDPRFLTQIRELHAAVAHFGVYNTLTQTLLKLTSPGVPDIYQGNELFDYSLVDPDNRRPVDYNLRQWLLEEIVQHTGSTVDFARTLSGSHDTRSKLFLTHKVLSYRRKHIEVFRDGDYLPLAASDDAAEHIVAFIRSLADATVISVAPRLLAKKLGENRLPLGTEAWNDALLILPNATTGETYRNVLTGEVVAVVEREGTSGLPLADALANFPVALLERNQRSGIRGLDD